MAASTSYFGSGDKGRGVRALQSMLNRAGYALEPDGNFGKNTRLAVVDFQKRSQITDDGKAGPFTFGALRSGGYVEGGVQVATDAMLDAISCRNELALYAGSTGNAELLDALRECDERLSALLGRPLNEAKPTGQAMAGVGVLPAVAVAVVSQGAAEAAVLAAGWTAAVGAAAWIGGRIRDACASEQAKFPNAPKPYSGTTLRGGGRPPVKWRFNGNLRKALKTLGRRAGQLSLWAFTVAGAALKGAASAAGSQVVILLGALVVWALGRRKGA